MKSFIAGLSLAGSVAMVLMAADERAEICTPGYAETHRMSESESHRIKREMVLELGWPATAVAEFELDHIVPLCLGGSNESSNLQLQPWPEARKKDRLEAAMCRAYCAGDVSLEAAREYFKRDQ